MPSFRITPQRRVILEELGKSRSHPTADELYDRVRTRLPRISLGTVYRNLDVLCKLGMIRSLELGGGQRRYEGRTEDHHHVRCLRCGRIDDVFADTEAPSLASYNDVPDYQVIGHRIEFIGYCGGCLRKNGRKTLNRADPGIPGKI